MVIQGLFSDMGLSDFPRHGKALQKQINQLHKSNVEFQKCYKRNKSNVQTREADLKARI